MALNSYSTGTIAIGASATAVVGVGTLWTDVNVRAGDTLIVAGHQVLVEDVTDATHLVIDAWPFTAVSAGASYKIVQNSPLRFAGGQAMADVSTLVSALNTDGYIVVVLPTETVPNPSYGDENQFAFQWGTGKLWTKSGGVWVFVGTFKGFTAKGTWSGATAYISGDVVTLNGSSYLCVLDHTNHTPPNVTYWQLLSSIGTTPWDVPAAWLTATSYTATAPASIVVQDGESYVCLVSHTSGTFATDLAAVKWRKIVAKPWLVPVAWVTATAYVAGPPASVVVQAGESYVCLVSHTSGTFATDLAATKWIKITQKGTGDLIASNNLSDVASAATSATNLAVVRYGGAQSLTAAQKSQARANIDVLKKNYIINGAMQVSQENGSTAVTTSGYPVDEFQLGISGTTGAVSAAQVASATPGGSPNRLRTTVTTADAAVAAGDIVQISQMIEGLRVVDLLFGTASARSIILQFGVKAPAGTYCVTVANSAVNRSYVAEYVISGGEANTDVVKSVTIPGDTSGTWLNDVGIGLRIYWGLMVGSTFQQTAGSWGTANARGSSNQFNLLGTNGNVFELFDVGIYEGTVAPLFQVPDVITETFRCQRYYNKLLVGAGAGTSVASGLSYTTTVALMSFNYPVAMRAAPTISLSSLSHWAIRNTGGNVNLTAFSATGASVNASRFDISVASGLTSGQACVLEALSTSGALILNARL